MEKGAQRPAMTMVDKDFTMRSVNTYQGVSHEQG